MSEKTQTEDGYGALLPQKDSPPVRRSFSQEEIVAEARRWLHQNYAVGRSENPDRFYERLGLLVDFVTDIVPGKE